MPGCKVGIITAPTTDGATVTETLPAGFTLRALMLAASYNTADGFVAGHARFSFGFASRDAAAIQQGGQLIHQDDATAASQTANGVFTTATLRQNVDGTTTTSEMEVDVTDMQNEQFTLTFTVAPASAIKIIYMAFSVAKARVVSQTHTTTSPETITAPAGWGQPDLVLGTHGGAQLNGFSDSSLTNAHMPLGVAVSDTIRQCSLFAMRDAQVQAASARWQKQRFMLGSSNNAATYEADLDIQANWPADGIQIVKPDLNPNGMGGVYLFIQDPDLQVAMGVGTIRTTIGDTDHAAGFAPAGALVFGSNIAASTTLGAADADGYQFLIGMTDGTIDCMVGVLDDDSAADMNTHTLFHSTKGLRYYTPVTPTLVSEADLSFSGNNLRVSTTDADTVAREYVWVVIGPPAAGDVTVPASAAIGLGSSPAPVKQVAVASSTAAALGLVPASTPAITVATGVATALGITPAPTVIAGPVTVTPAAAVALGIAPAPTPAIASPASVAAAFGQAPAVTADVTVPVSIASALGIIPGPTLAAVVPISPAIAQGITPAPTVISGSGSTVQASAATALGIAPAPTSLVGITAPISTALGLTANPQIQVQSTTTPATATGAAQAIAIVGILPAPATATGATQAPQLAFVIFPSAALATGSAPAPLVIAGVLVVPASLSVSDASTATAEAADASGATVAVESLSEAFVAVSDTVN